MALSSPPMAGVATQVRPLSTPHFFTTAQARLTHPTRTAASARPNQQPSSYSLSVRSSEGHQRRLARLWACFCGIAGRWWEGREKTGEPLHDGSRGGRRFQAGAIVTRFGGSDDLAIDLAVILFRFVALSSDLIAVLPSE
jgi:hypothetical protein